MGLFATHHHLRPQHTQGMKAIIIEDVLYLSVFYTHHFSSNPYLTSLVGPILLSFRPIEATPD